MKASNLRQIQITAGLSIQRFDKHITM